MDKQLPLFDPVEIPLTKGYIALVDPIDADLIQFKWCVTEHKNNAYAHRQVWVGKQQMERMHRVVLSRILGRPLNSHEHVDHINHDGLDNRRSNLRVATHSQNMQNSRKHSSPQALKGVSKAGKKWEARIRINGIQTRLGTFLTPEDAYVAYCKASAQYHGEFSCID